MAANSTIETFAFTGAVKMAGPTRLELATSGVTGRRSIQLNYDPDMTFLTTSLVGGTGFEPVTPGL
jgi:hypothetical protein